MPIFSNTDTYLKRNYCFNLMLLYLILTKYRFYIFKKLHSNVLCFQEKNILLPLIKIIKYTRSVKIFTWLSFSFIGNDSNCQIRTLKPKVHMQLNYCIV